MKGPVVSHFRLLTIFSLVFLNVDKKGTLAARMPISSGKFMLVETPDNTKPSDYLVVEGAKCESCLGNKFDTSQSSTVKKVGQDTSERRYNQVVVTGTEWSDRVCLAETTCIDEFEFFLVETQSFLKEPIDGFLGLARDEPFLTGEL